MEADDANGLKNKCLSHITGIPKSNLDSYLDGLIGFVYNQAEQLSWNISKISFDAKCEELTGVFCKREFTFPPFSGYEATAHDIKSHQDKLFVQKICHIEHFDVIPDAVGNWMELQNSLCKELDEYPLYAKKTRHYQEQLVKLFKLHYSTSQIEFVDQIKNSKILYNKVITEHPINLDNSMPPIEYKNGLIHDAMDDEERDLKWRVEP